MLTWPKCRTADLRYGGGPSVHARDALRPPCALHVDWAPNTTLSLTKGSCRITAIASHAVQHYHCTHGRCNSSLRYGSHNEVSHCNTTRPHADLHWGCTPGLACMPRPSPDHPSSSTQAGDRSVFQYRRVQLQHPRYSRNTSKTVCSQPRTPVAQVQGGAACTHRYGTLYVW